MRFKKGEMSARSWVFDNPQKMGDNSTIAKRTEILRREGRVGMNNNVMLYWDDATVPADIVAIREQWRRFCPGWNVILFSKETACRFLRENYGADMLRLFLTCALPTMRADFFRVFWAIAEGGIYSDLRFVPLREPLFFDPDKDLTVGRKPDGLIRNGAFFCKKGCKEMKLIAFEMMMSVSKKEIREVDMATGPKLWAKTLPKRDTDTMQIIDWRKDMLRFLEFSDYPSCTRDTENHWLNLQRRMSIYCDSPETSTPPE